MMTLARMTKATGVTRLTRMTRVTRVKGPTEEEEGNVTAVSRGKLKIRQYFG